MNAETVAQASCAQVDADLWFPEAGESEKAVRAIRICRTCPIETKCRDYALRHYVAGIWGGTTERQRQAIRRERGIAIQREINHGTPGGYRTHRRRGEIPCAECHAASVRDNRRKHALATLTPKGDRL